MDDAGPAGSSHLTHFGIVSQETMGQRSRRAPGAGVDREPGGLVQDDKGIFFVDYPEIAGLGGHFGTGVPHQRIPFERLAKSQVMRSLGGFAIDQDSFGPDPLLDLVTGEAQVIGQKAVEAHPGGLRWDGGESLYDGSGVASALCFGDKKMSTAISTMPTLMALSAMLNVCQW